MLRRSLLFLVTFALLLSSGSGTRASACTDGNSPWGPLEYPDCFEDMWCEALHQNVICEWDSCLDNPDCNIQSGYQSYCILPEYCAVYPACWNQHCA